MVSWTRSTSEFSIVNMSEIPVWKKNTSSETGRRLWDYNMIQESKIKINKSCFVLWCTQEALQIQEMLVFFFSLSDNSVEDKSSLDECFSLQDAKYKNIDENG